MNHNEEFEIFAITDKIPLLMLCGRRFVSNPQLIYLISSLSYSEMKWFLAMVPLNYNLENFEMCEKRWWTELNKKWSLVTKQRNSSLKNVPKIVSLETSHKKTTWRWNKLQVSQKFFKHQYSQIIKKRPMHLLLHLFCNLFRKSLGIRSKKIRRVLEWFSFYKIITIIITFLSFKSQIFIVSRLFLGKSKQEFFQVSEC